METGAMCLKYIWLKLGRFKRKIFRRLPIILSYIFLVFSVLTSFVLLVPNCFNRIPVLSYFINEHKLPMTYELCGEVNILDENNDIINKDVEVFVGGYKTSLGISTEFSLEFVSPEISEVFVVIRYEVEGEVCEFTRCLVIEDSNHVIKEGFTIYA